MVKISSTSPEAISSAAQILRDGGLVGMPTETVYGLAANAKDGKAVARIFEAKGRPQFNPLIVHCASIEDVETIAEINNAARILGKYFWPGPLTMILPRKENSGLSDLVSAGLPTVAVRIPAHKDALALIKAAGVPLAAPSANKSGTLSPTTPKHVADSLGSAVDMILAAGPCKVGLESTVIDLSTSHPAVLRPGAVSAEELSRILGQTVPYDAGDGENVKSPGQLLKHYAPGIPVRLNAIDLLPGEALLGFGSLRFMGIRGGGAALNLPEESVRNLSENADLHEAASNLFTMMRALDTPQHKAIAVMNIPENGIGKAINDRLERASRGT
ncbi:MAG: threonylcarbamoyl-AMP synthase [Alphaproteobacteria bacterium]|nr:threonylcarbamoyl-AMP synthase [Alphaproteobacteria bacterium]